MSVVIIDIPRATPIQWIYSSILLTITKMTKYIRLFIVCFTLFFPVVFFGKVLEAKYHLLPVVGQPADIDQTSSPTFGRILGQTTEGEKPSTENAEQKTQELLARLDEMTGDSQQRLAELNITPKTEMVDNIYALATTPAPTYHPKIQKLLADEAISQITDNSESEVSNLQPTTYNPPTQVDVKLNSNIGVMDENPEKTSYTIALLGDSMVETMGKDLPHLQNLLEKAFPKYSFLLLNYGQGATDLDSGLYRLTNSTRYLDKEFPALLSYKPDILVVESFAYNHWSGEIFNFDRQWLTIASIIDTIKKDSLETKIILGAAIAPNGQVFGDGKLNWPQDLKWNAATITKAYLQNLVNFATSEHYPLADAFHPSLDSAGNGLERYIDQSDHLHPSNEGKLLFSQKIVEAIVKNELIK